MSVFSARTGLSSILKAYKPTEREKAKAAVINKVRFEMPKMKGMEEAVLAVKEHNNYQLLNEYMEFLKEDELEEGEFLRTFFDARKIVHMLSPKFTPFVEVLLAVKWLERSTDAVQLYSDFYVDLLVANNKHLQIGIDRLISLMIPNDNNAEHWLDNKPTPKLANELQAIHAILRRIMNAVPMSFDVILETIEKKFPYFKRPPHVIVGYMHNLLWMTEYKPIFTEYVVQLLLKKLIILDVNAPRNEIEETEEEEEDDEEDEVDKFEGADVDLDEMKDNEEIFQMDDVVKETLPMNHPIAHTLDMCMQKMFNYLDTLNPTNDIVNEEQKLIKQTEAAKFLKILLEAFECTILPCHNTHHVQFVVFYFCSFKSSYAEAFLRKLWDKTKNPNNSAIIRQTCVGYIASFLARCKTVPLSVLKNYLLEFSNWAHQYIDRVDQCRSNNSLKANLVFYSICQAIFYVIAFRSRDLTTDKKGLLFLQSMHLSALVTCNFNPLRVTLPAVATAFAGVTRAYQLAYCHAILERNARRKLATIYANDMETPEETLDTFFPFDPYMLKSSVAYIAPNYLQYKPSEVEENHQHEHNVRDLRTARKRGDSEMLDDHDIDDFLVADKRQRFLELAKSQEREAQFTYGLSPGFHQ